MENKIAPVKDMQKELKTKGFLSLEEFFTAEQFHAFKKEIRKSKSKDSFKLGYHSYTTKEVPKDIETFLASKMFSSLLKTAFGKAIKITPKLFVFTQGNYILLQDDSLKGFHGLIDFSDNLKEECGGFISFFQNDEEIVRRAHKKNSLFFFSFPRETESFVKYMNCTSKDKEAIYLFF